MSIFPDIHRWDGGADDWHRRAVNTAHERHVNQVLINFLRNAGYAGHIAVTAHGPADVARLEQAGADLVLTPFTDAASEVVDRILGQAATQPVSKSAGYNVRCGCVI